VGSFILKRLLNAIAVLFGITTLVFFLFRILPGNSEYLKQGEAIDVAAQSRILADQNRNQPLFLQYFLYLNDLSPISLHNLNKKESGLYFDQLKYPSAKIILKLGTEKIIVVKPPYLRRSYQSNRKVSDILMDALPETALLALMALALAAVIGISLGALAALYQGKFMDKITLLFSVLAMSMPAFLIGILIAWIFGYLLSEFTGLNMTGSLYTQDDYGNGEFLDLKNAILPAFALSLRPLAILAQLTRTTLMDVLSQDFVRTAKAKGLATFKIVTKHVLRNAASPLLTAISGWLAGLMAGAVFIETIFGWKGIGKEVVDALDKYDLPVVMGAVLLFAVLFLVIQFLIDLIQAFFDPRIRLS